ncbi:MAG: AI-2E family transporter [Acidimicrobiales bacterium]
MVERVRRAGQISWAVVGVVALLVLLGIVAWFFRVIWPPLILAGAIVFVLNPVVTWLQRRHIPRALGTGLTYLGVVGVVVLISVLVAPLAQNQADDLADEWPELRANLEEDINDLSRRSEEDNWPVHIPTWDELGDSFSDDNRTFEEELDRVRELGLRVFRVALILVLAPIIAFYLLVDLPHLRRVAESLIPERSKAEVLVVARRLNRAIGGFFRGQLVVALIVGTMVSIGLAILGLPFWLLVGMIAGLFNMIPLIGPYIGAIPGIVIAFTAGDGMSQAIWVAVIMTAAQQIDNHFITPNVMQRVVKLHPAAVMLALLAGGTIGGFFGLLLAVPAAAILKIIIGHVWRTYVLGEPIAEIAAEVEAADSGRGGLVSGLFDEDVDLDVDLDEGVEAPDEGELVLAEAPDGDQGAGDDR